MGHVTSRHLVLLLAAMVAPLGCPGSANAALVAGPGGSLTLVESERWLPDATVSRLYSSSGSLQGGMSSPVAISEPGDTAQESRLAVDAAGNVVAVWSSSRCYEGFNRYFVCLSIPRGIWYAWKPPGGSFTTPQQLVAPAPGEGSVLLATDPGGDVVVGYEERGSVFIRRGHANGPFGTPIQVMSRSLSRGSQAARLDYVGLSSRGELLVVSHQRFASGKLEARVASPGRGLGPPQVIAPQSGRQELPAICCGFPEVVVAMGSRGDALIAWDEKVQNGQEQLEAVYRPAGGHFGALQHLTKPQSTLTPSPKVAAVDGHGHAVLAMIQYSGQVPLVTPLVEVSESNSSGNMSSPSTLGTNGHPGAVEELSLADNPNGEMALRYSETSPPGAAVDGDPFSVDLRFSANGQPLGAPQTLKTGTLGCLFELTSSLISRNPGCESVPALVGANEQAFYATYGFKRELNRDTSEWAVEIQRVTQAGTGAPTELTLPVRVGPQPEPAPATLVDFDTGARADVHGRVHGHITCGDSAAASCVAQITIETAARPNVVLAQTRVSVRPVPIGRHALTVTLDRAARHLLARHRALAAVVLTSTANPAGPATETDYPLTLRAA